MRIIVIPTPVIAIRGVEAGGDITAIPIGTHTTPTTTRPGHIGTPTTMVHTGPMVHTTGLMVRTRTRMVTATGIMVTISNIS